MSATRALGDLAMVVEVADGPGDWQRVRGVARRIEASGCEGISEVVPALNSVAVHLRRSADWNEVAESVEAALRDGVEVGGCDEGREIEIPVDYSGEDLGKVAGAAGIPEEEVVRRHSGGRYRVLALGFAPGFPYLDGLDVSLHCPRLETPRTRVAAGSVGIGGGQTGIYPVKLPGGWNLIGRTAETLFDPSRDQPNLLRAGDLVRFRPVEKMEPGSGVRPRADVEDPGEGVLEVIDPGLQASVQDTGRTGFQAIGVTEGGAVDRKAMRVANLLVGNGEDAAGLEWAVRGPKLKFRERRLVAVTGAGTARVPFGRPFVVESGEVLDLSAMPAGFRGYLAISGGIEVEVVLGGRGTSVAGGFGGLGGRWLRKGDLLAAGRRGSEPAAGGWWASPAVAERPERAPVAIRVMRGPEAGVFGEEVWRRFLDGEYTVGSDSDRMGTRLKGEPVAPAEPVEMVSQPVVAGTVQVPRDGHPIVLMADRQSLGGYPRIATVISVDVGRVAQVAPGCRVKFEECGLDEAQRLRLAEEKDLRLFASGVQERMEERG